MKKKTHIHSSTSRTGQATFEKKNTLELVKLKKQTRTSGGTNLTTKSINLNFSQFI
jgi:hypothetical protein